MSDAEAALAEMTAAPTETEQTTSTTETATSELQTSNAAPEPIKTDADKWREYLATFDDEASARAVIKRKAAETGWAKGTAYKQLKKIKFRKAPVKAKEATFKIAKVDVPEPDTEPEPDILPEPTPAPAPAPAPQPTFAYNPYQQVAPPAAQMDEEVLGDVAQSLWGLLCDMKNAPDAARITDKEKAKIAHYVMPVAQTRFPSVVNNPEVVALFGAGSIVAHKIKILMDASAEESPADVEPEPEPTPAPTAQPMPAQPEQSDEPAFKDSKPNWMKKLPR